MIDPKTLEDIAKKVTSKLPGNFGSVKDEMEKNVKAGLQAAFQKMDLVTREEFDIQTKILAKCRARIDALEKEIESLKK